MSQYIYRLLFLLFIIAGSARMSAQASVPAGSSDAAIWVVGSALGESEIIDEGDVLVIDFEETPGFGLSFNHFWTDVFSTEFALQKYAAEMAIALEGGPAFDAGEIDITSFTAMAQLHFNRDGRLSPYIGVGGAYISGEFDPPNDPDEPVETIGLEPELAWTAAAGANIAITRRISLVGEIKYIPWSAIEEDGSEEDAIDVDPVTFAAGVRFRF